MYHIKQDKRAEESVELICDGLMKCLEEKNINDITVSDIQRSSTVSRSTFYRNFDGIDDVLSLMCDRCFEEAFASGLETVSEAVFRKWFEYGTLLEAVVQIRRTDILFNSLRRSAAHLPALQGIIDAADFGDYLISIITSTMAGIFVTWIEHGRHDSEQELMNKVKKSFGTLTALKII